MSSLRRKDREIIHKEEILEILNQADVSHLGLTDGTRPYVVALSYGYEDGVVPRLWFHGAMKGRKTDLILNNPEAFFLIDTDHQLVPGPQACDYTMLFRSVSGSGRIRLVTEDSEKIYGLNIIMKHYTGRNDFEYAPEMLRTTSVMCLEIREMTGKKKTKSQL